MAGQSSTAAVRNKLVVRRLPPTLPEELFWKAVSPWINEKTCSWKRYVKGKAGDGSYDSHPTHSRAYVLMSSPEALVDLHKGFDGHVFKSKTGVEYQAVVEYAPVQKTPFKAKVKTDARQGTIDEDPDYQSFLETHNAVPTKPTLEVSAPVSQPTSTPLLDHLRAQGKSGKGKSKSKSSAQSSSSATESARRAAAIASVTAAASKRAPQAGNGPLMVAGKGREVLIATPSTSNPATPDAAGASVKQDEKKKGRGRKKGGKKEGETANGAGEKDGQTSGPSQKPAAAKGSSTQPARNAQAPSAGTSGIDQPVASGSGSGPGSKVERGGVSNKGKGGAKEGSNAEGSGRGGRGGGGRGGGGGGGKGVGEGGGKGPGEGGGKGGKDRSGRGQVMEILSRNTAPGSGGGGVQGKGKGGNATPAGSTSGAKPVQLQAKGKSGATAGPGATANAGTTSGSRTRIDVP